jgi:hypothetical protein
MEEVCGTPGKDEQCIENFRRKPEEKEPLGRTDRKLENYFKKNI